jgi:hypothetical protein
MKPLQVESGRVSGVTRAALVSTSPPPGSSVAVLPPPCGRWERYMVAGPPVLGSGWGLVAITLGGNVFAEAPFGSGWGCIRRDRVAL